MASFKNIAGTVLDTFRVGFRVILSASGLTAPRTYTLPDRDGEVALRAEVLKIASLRA